MANKNVWKIQKARSTDQVVLFHEHDGYPYVCKKMGGGKWFCMGCHEEPPAAFVTAHKLARM